MTQPTNSIDSELRQIIGQIPNYIFEYLELSDEIKKEWKYGSKASDFGGHNQFVHKFVAQIEALYRKEIEEALKDRVCTLCRDNTRLSHKGSNYIGSCPVENENLLLAELRAKLLPPTKGENNG